MKVLYFTSTGNSLWVARHFTDTPLSIVQLLHSGDFGISDDEAIGIVVPDHVCDIPAPVREYLMQANLDAPYKFAIITYGSDAAAAPERLLELQHVDYLNTILMVDNYFPVFNQKEQVEEAPKKDITRHLDLIISDIRQRRRFINYSDKEKKIKGDEWREYYLPQLSELSKNFHVDHDKCVKCGICAKVCPMGNISYDPWPEFGTNCLLCGACRQNCPRSAIRWKGEKDTYQYRHADITVADIIKANNIKER